MNFSKSFHVFYNPSYQELIQYNTVKPKAFKPNLLDEPKDIKSGIFLFFIFAFFKPKLFLNRSQMAGPLKFGLTVLYYNWTKETGRYLRQIDYGGRQDTGI